jgi:hypothetical protein
MTTPHPLRPGLSPRDHWRLTDVCPAALTVTTPPQVQLHCDESSRALTSPIVTWAEPGDHGESTGWHGCGVRVPEAALVAEATCGLDSDMHIPNGGTFSAATSVTTPAGLPAEVCAPDAANVAGVVPKEHCKVAPVQTRFGMACPRARREPSLLRRGLRRNDGDAPMTPSR